MASDVVVAGCACSWRKGAGEWTGAVGERGGREEGRNEGGRGRKIMRSLRTKQEASNPDLWWNFWTECDNEADGNQKTQHNFPFKLAILVFLHSCLASPSLISSPFVFTSLLFKSLRIPFGLTSTTKVFRPSHTIFLCADLV